MGTVIVEVWITKYALTKGIIRAANVQQDYDTPSMIHVGPVSGYHSYYHGEGGEWHRTLESAQKKAEEMRQKKIASMKKQIAKLEKQQILVGEWF